MSNDYVQYDLSKDFITLNIKKEDEKEQGSFYNSLLHDKIYEILSKIQNKEKNDKRILLKGFNTNSPCYYFFLNNDLYIKHFPNENWYQKINSRKDKLIEEVAQYLTKAEKYDIIPVPMQKLKKCLSVVEKRVKKEELEIFEKYKKIIDDTIQSSNSKFNENKTNPNLLITILKDFLLIIIIIIVWLFFVYFANNINQYFPSFNFCFLFNFKKNEKKSKIQFTPLITNSKTINKNYFSFISDVIQKVKNFIFVIFGNAGVISIFKLIRVNINNYNSKRIKKNKVVDIMKKEIRKLESQNKDFNFNRELLVEMAEETYLKKGEFIYKYLDEFDEFFKDDDEIKRGIENKNLSEKIFEFKEIFIDKLLNEQNIFLKLLFNTLFLIIIILLCFILNSINNSISFYNYEKYDSSNKEISEMINKIIKNFCTEDFVFFGTKLFLSYLFAGVDNNITIKYIYEEIKYEINKKRNTFYMKQSDGKKERDDIDDYSNYLNGVSLDEIKKIIQKYIKSDDKNYNDVYLLVKNKLVDDISIKVVRGDKEKNTYYLVNEKN